MAVMQVAAVSIGRGLYRQEFCFLFSPQNHIANDLSDSWDEYKNGNRKSQTRTTKMKLVIVVGCHGDATINQIVYFGINGGCEA